MATLVTTHQNFGKWVIEGQFDLSAAAAVLTLTDTLNGTTRTVRGDGMTVVKNGTGNYDLTIKGTGLMLYETLKADAHLQATVLATALDARIGAITQTASTGDILVKVITCQTTGAAADTTAAVTVGFDLVFRTVRPGSPL